MKEMVNAFLLQCRLLQTRQTQQGDAKECTFRPNHSTKKNNMYNIQHNPVQNLFYTQVLKKLYIRQQCRVLQRLKRVVSVFMYAHNPHSVFQNQTQTHTDC